jgi:hypothetical protein
MNIDAVLWKRVDVPGHDACRLDEGPAAWTIRGTAVFREAGTPAMLAYEVVCDLAWHTHHGRIHGWIGNRSLDVRITRTTAGVWALNGETTPNLEGCIDLDLGFTPATNLIAVRRLALPIGRAADAPAAWFDVSAGTLGALEQRYERRTETAYWYESPKFGYAALLETTPTGFVTRYPDLCEAE